MKSYFNYKKYKWFYTASGKLVVGGKSAELNDLLLKEIKKTGKECYVMHTADPGSPFCAIMAPVKEATLKDLEECAIFTGCFSRAWKQQKRKTEIHIFKSSQLSKIKSMKPGTWSVNGDVNKMGVELKLALAKQEGVYRAVPLKTVAKLERVVIICPGETDKTIMAESIIKKLKDKHVKKEEIIAALPAGGVEIC